MEDLLAMVLAVVAWLLWFGFVFSWCIGSGVTEQEHEKK